MWARGCDPEVNNQDISGIAGGRKYCTLCG